MQPKGRSSYIRGRAYVDRHKPKGPCYCLQCDTGSSPVKARQKRIDQKDIEDQIKPPQLSWLEHEILNLGVLGSNPRGGTNQAQYISTKIYYAIRSCQTN